MSELEKVDLLRFRCADCAYGASAAKQPRQCPMCGGTRWQTEEWRALERLPADLHRYRGPVEVSVPARDELEEGQSARAGMYVLSSVLLSLAATWLGVIAARALLVARSQS